MNPFYKNLALWLVITLMMIMLYNLFNQPPPTETSISYTQFLSMVEDERISEVLIQGQELLVTDTDGSRFKIYFPQDDDLIRILREKGVAINAKPPAESPWFVSVLVSWFPMLILIGVWIFFMRQMQSGGGKALSFGKSRARLLSDSSEKVTFEDVAGIDEAKEELGEIVEFLKEPKKFTRLGGRIPKGVILMGSPGTGKTLLGRAIAGEADVPFFSISGSDFVEMFVGVGASVTGDTPVLIRDAKGTRLLPIGEFADSFYFGKTADFVVPVKEVETLGFVEKDSKFAGSSKTFFGHSDWQPVKGVYRHWVDEIYEIHYLGGVICTTGDHSVFIRTRDGIKAVPASELKPEDVLVNLPFKTRGVFSPDTGTPHEIRAHQFDSAMQEEEWLTVWEEDEAVRTAYTYAMAQKGQVSQYAIGQNIGVSQATVGNWHSGQHLPRALSDRYNRTQVPQQVRLTPDLMKVLGYYTAEGRVNNSVEFVFGSHESAYIREVLDLMADIFGLHAHVIHTESNSARLTFYASRLGPFFERMAGNGSHKKHVPEILWDLPREYFLAYLEGYALGDGYTNSDGKLIVASVSRQLIRELSWLCAMHGIAVGVGKTVLPEGRIIRKKPLPKGHIWRMTIGKRANPFRTSTEEPDMAKRPIVREVVRLPYNGFVYDLVGCGNEAFFGGEKPVLLHNSRVRDLFVQGKKNAPCIIFIDEIDAVGRHRGAGLGGGHDEREQTLNQLLVEMDGFESNEGVILIAATNRPDVLDPALMRPGRFDRQVVVSLPDIRGREKILRVHMKKTPVSPDVDPNALAKGTPGFSGADLENLVNESALLAAKRNKDKIDMTDLEDSKDKVYMGLERKSMVLTDEDKKITAYHEAGHALVTRFLPGTDAVNKITIIPRGRALGVTWYLPEERYTQFKDEYQSKLSVAFGGRAAEEIIFGRISSGASSDIKQATDIAQSMIRSWGMGEDLGPISYAKNEEQIFLGREIAQHRDYSDDTANKIDAEISNLINAAYQRSKKILEENIDILHKLAELLLENETVLGKELDELIFSMRPGIKLPSQQSEYKQDDKGLKVKN